MTKKLSNGTKKANPLSLREFIAQAPGQLPLESCLPSKPGDGPNRDSSEYLAHKLASASLHSNGVGAGRYSGEQVYSKPIAYDSADHHNSSHGGRNGSYGGGYAGMYGNGGSYANGSGGRAYGGSAYGGSAGSGERYAGAAPGGADSGAYYSYSQQQQQQQQQRMDDGSYGRGPYAGYADFDAPPKRYSGPGAPIPGSMPPGAAAHGNATNAAFFLPPPPPPPRPAQQQQQQQQGLVEATGAGLERDVQHRRGGSSALVDGSISNSAGNGSLALKRRPAGPGRASPVPAGAAENGVGGAQLLVADAGKAAGKQLAAKEEGDAQHKDQEPTAPALEPVQQQQEVQQPAAPPPPKNEFAARMAQAAAARMASRANSTSLLSGSPTATTTDAAAAAVVTAPTAKPAAVRPTFVLKQHVGFDAAPAATRQSLPQPSGAPLRSPPKSLFANGGGATAAADTSARPKLQLQPRSLPVAAAAAPEAPAERWGSGGIGSEASHDPSRPRIKLLPRGAATAATADAPKTANGAAHANGSDQTAADVTAKRVGSGSSSVFGAARPREQVLRERGVDPETAFTESPRATQRLTEASLSARGGNGSRGTSVTSGEEDAWHTVGKHGRAGRSGSGVGSNDGNGMVGSYGEDPFALFGSSKAVVAPQPTRFAVDIGAPHHNPHFARGNGSYNSGTYGSYGSYGSPAGAGFGNFGGRAEGAAAAAAADQEDGADGIFRRALPVRSDLLL